MVADGAGRLDRPVSRRSERAWRKADEALRFHEAVVRGGWYKGVKYPGRCRHSPDLYGVDEDLTLGDVLLAQAEAAYDSVADAIPEWAGLRRR